MTKIVELIERLRHRPVSYRLIAFDLVRGVVIFGALTVVVQLLYPPGRLLPSVEVQGFDIGGQRLSEAKAALSARYEKATLVVQAGDTKVATTLAEIGVTVNARTTVDTLASYPLYQRLIPFSSLVIMSRDRLVDAKYDAKQMHYFAEQVSKKAFVPAVNAGVTVKDGQATLVPAKPGREYPAANVAQAIRGAALLPNTKVVLPPVAKPAARNDEEVKAVLQAAQKSVDAPLTVTLNGESFRVDKNTVGSWLEFDEDASGNLQLRLKKDTAEMYLESIQSKIYIAPGITKIKLVDGVEVGRTIGTSGRSIAMDKALARLAAVIGSSSSRTVGLPITTVVPKIVYNRTLSNSDAGLAALLQDIVKSKGDYGIAVIEIDGRSGKANGSKQYTSASTYKLFVAYGVFQWIQSGKLHWSDPIVNGYNAEECFDAMIVKSDNDCAKAFGITIGWDNIDDMMTSVGLTATQVKSGAQLTTASDLALFLYKLQSGTLLNSGDRARLIDAMERQIYRSGIPAGTGVKVADKVGFLYGLLHDAAIVYGKKGPYVLVIMSDGSSWSQLADAAEQINDFLSQ